MKTMIITGGSGTIGSMTAYLAVKEGWRVLLAYHKNEQGARHLQEDLAPFEGELLLFQGDLTKKEDRERLFLECEPLEPDVLVNNFGVARYCPFTEETEEGIAQALHTNLFSHMALTRRILPLMLAKGRGSIINISSVWGQTGGSCEVAYSAAKAGLLGFTKALAKEVAPAGIYVNCVAPGIVESKMLLDLDRDALKEQLPKGALANGLDIAKTILFLAGQEHYIGQVLSPNGGMYI